MLPTFHLSCSFRWRGHESRMFGPILKIWHGMWLLGQHLAVATKKEEKSSNSRKNRHILQSMLQRRSISQDGRMHKIIKYFKKLCCSVLWIYTTLLVFPFLFFCLDFFSSALADSSRFAWVSILNAFSGRVFSKSIFGRINCKVFLQEALQINFELSKSIF